MECYTPIVERVQEHSSSEKIGTLSTSTDDVDELRIQKIKQELREEVHKTIKNELEFLSHYLQDVDKHQV
ncbi:2586_t:CDS:1, partial [Scutellospora calospora]